MSNLVGNHEGRFSHDAVHFLLQYFVDLAGSEKAGENSGDRFKEGCAINKSLFALGNVIRKLSGDEKYEEPFHGGAT